MLELESVSIRKYYSPGRIIIYEISKFQNIQIDKYSPFNPDFLQLLLLLKEAIYATTLGMVTQLSNIAPLTRLFLLVERVERGLISTGKEEAALLKETTLERADFTV